jgi:hypothetical protein
MLASAPDDGQAYRWTVLGFDETGTDSVAA